MDAPVSVSEESDDLAPCCAALAEVEELLITDSEGVGFTRVDAGVGLGEVGGGQE